MSNQFKEKIVIKGAREHNLKNIDVEIPRDKLVVICGLSGSGKSSLAFDTIYAEGQRRYVESLSSYARQFLGLMEKPDVDQIEGLSPAISIDQKTAPRNPRSTVGTITEIYDYLRLLYARVGTPHCPQCGAVVQRQTSQQIVDKIKEFKEGSKIAILAPVVKGKKGEHRHIFEELKKAGYIMVRVDKKIYDLEEEIELDKYKIHDIDVIVDRLVVPLKDEDDEEGEKIFSRRLFDSVEASLKLGEGVIKVVNLDSGEEMVFSEHFACDKCGISLPEIEPRSFSFNSPYGACPYCTGLGTKFEIDPELVVPNPSLSIAEGAIRFWTRTTSGSNYYIALLEEVGKKHGFSVNQPYEELSPESQKIIMYGTDDEKYLVRFYNRYGRYREIWTQYEGVIPHMMRRYEESDSEYIKKEIEKYMREVPCPVCEGKRLKKEFLAVEIGGLSISDLSALSVEKIKEFFEKLQLDERKKTIAGQILKEIKNRIQFLEDVGLNYLSLDRRASTLSGGEAQRIRLATQLGSRLMGVLYILDEPSIGLHQRDNAKLIKTLKDLRDLGNSVIVVEHDEETINSSDWIIELGPGAGEKGGYLVAQGTVEDIKNNPNSLTGQYLSGKKKIEIPQKRRSGNGKYLEIIGASEFNLKNIDVKIPLGTFTAITGVSGSGKSTLMYEILAKALSQKFYRSKDKPGKHKEIKGIEYIDKIINIDQSPIGRTPRSNPATYTGVFTLIRDLFATTKEARLRGYGPGKFSFNVRGGRCEACRGEGLVKIEMYFLPDVWVKCDECKGKRYNPDVLEITFKGKNIAEVLEMSVEEALEFFQNIPAIKNKLQVLYDVGLGYIKLGQPATTLSGGEAQRVKLAAELSRKSTGKTLYILDEPTVGLHFEDVKNLLNILQRLVDKGNTVLIIEHNLDVIKSCDWIIDLGPEGGEKGGYIIAEGTPEKVAQVKESYTGQYLKKVLAGEPLVA